MFQRLKAEGELMQAKSGLIVPDPDSTDGIRLIMTGNSSIIQSDDGYHGSLRISKGDKEVFLRVTEKQAKILGEMGIAEWC